MTRNAPPTDNLKPLGGTAAPKITCPCGEMPLAWRLSLMAAGTMLLATGGLTYLLRPGQEEVAAFLNLVGMLVLGGPIFWDAVTGLLASRGPYGGFKFYMDQFVALALLACFAAGEYVTGGVVALVLVVGHLLEERSILGVQQAVNSLLHLSKTTARRIEPATGEEIETDAEALTTGDRVRVRPGDLIPADGVVLSGSSTADQASVTGESLPVDLIPGTRVFAGTQNLTGALEVEVERAGERSLIGRVGQIVLEAQQTRAPIIRLTEEYAAYYTPLILLIAAFVLFYTGDMMRAIAVIIVSIPCAFVLAGPATMVAALAAASRLGILVKSVRFFETATDIDAVVFDKTGTLTHGRLHVARMFTHGSHRREEALALAAAAEANSTHPVARAVVTAAAKERVPVSAASDVTEDPGQGVRATVEGKAMLVGRRHWVEAQNDFGGDFGPANTSGASELVVAVDGQPAATLLLADNLRDEARSIGARLGEVGIQRFTMLTGDNQQVADTIAAEVGFTDVAAQCLPEDKLKRVHAIKAEGHRVAVVGDGINDAPALAAGDLSVAMGAAGSDIAIQTADIALMNNDLHRLPALFRLSREAIRVINQNLLVGLVFVLISIVAAALGLIGPIAAAVLHETSAFFVIFNSARLLRFEED